MRNAVRVAAIGLVAWLVVYITAMVWPSAQQQVTVIVVVIGTALSFLMRLGFGSPAGDRKKGLPPRDDERRDQPASGINRRRLATVVVALLLVAIWLLAILVGVRFDDPASRYWLLSAINQLTASLVSIAVLIMPTLRLSFRDQGARLNSALAIAIGCLFLAGTTALPNLARAIWGSSYGVEVISGAIPGWSFLPIAAMAARVCFEYLSARAASRRRSGAKEE
jgi:hypothetical protein